MGGKDYRATPTRNPGPQVLAAMLPEAEAASMAKCSGACGTPVRAAYDAQRSGRGAEDCSKVLSAQCAMTQCAASVARNPPTAVLPSALRRRHRSRRGLRELYDYTGARWTRSTAGSSGPADRPRNRPKPESFSDLRVKGRCRGQRDTIFYGERFNNRIICRRFLGTS